jgi:RNA polymerase sigma-70 factor (ECF subfamily)
LGVPEHAVEDAAQQVFMVATCKIAPVELERERSFLFQVVLRVAADDRRARRRHPDTAGRKPSFDLPDLQPPPDELVDRQKARTVLDTLIGELPMELRVVFVLFEMEEMTTAQIAELLAVPAGTVASRLRRGRELFEAAVSRYRIRAERGGLR